MAHHGYAVAKMRGIPHKCYLGQRVKCSSGIQKQGGFVSRYQEIPLTIIFLLLSLPIQFFVFGIIRAQLGAPVMFSQVRAGLNGHEIVLRKFRTMTDARDPNGALLPDDQRQTRLTRLIRRLRMDELPQLWFVLNGKMALVGPRPLLPQTLVSFGAAGRMRNSVRPGLTGWSQVSGNTRLSNDEKLAMDLWYVAHRSFPLDMRVLAETFLVPLRGEVRDDARLRAATDWARAQYGAPIGETV